MMGVVTEDRFPHVEKLKSLGGVNTEEGDLYAKKYWEELENEYDAIMKLFQFRYKLGGNEKIHGINEKEDRTKPHTEYVKDAIEGGVKL